MQFPTAPEVYSALEPMLPTGYARPVVDVHVTAGNSRIEVFRRYSPTSGATLFCSATEVSLYVRGQRAKVAGTTAAELAKELLEGALQGAGGSFDWRWRPQTYQG